MRTSALALVALLTAVVGSAIHVVVARHESRQQFVLLQQQTRDRDELNIEFGRLQLEQATWAETNRIEQIARSRLGMVEPGDANTVVIRR